MLHNVVKGIYYVGETVIRIEVGVPFPPRRLRGPKANPRVLQKWTARKASESAYAFALSMEVGDSYFLEGEVRYKNLSSLKRICPDHEWITLPETNEVHGKGYRFWKGPKRPLL